MLGDTDIWWHLKAGEAISSLGRIPTYDLFSFSNGENIYPWFNISWLWDVAYYWLYQISGEHMYLPLVVTGIINALTLSLLIWLMLSRGVKVITAFMVFILCVIPYSYMITPRPHEITFLMTVIFYAALQIAVSGNKKLLLLLPALMVIWVNCHGGFLVGFTILGAYMFAALCARNKNDIKWISATIIACALATLINPLGIEIIAACKRTLASEMVPYISEWDPMRFDPAFTLHMFYMLFFLVIFNPLSKNVSLAEKILSVFWVISSLQHERNMPLGVLLSAPVFAIRIEDLLAHLPPRLKNGIINANNDYEKDLQRPRVKKIIFASSLLVIIFLLCGGAKSWVDIPLDDTKHAVKETEYVKQNYSNLNILTDYFQGGYIIYGLDGTSRIFVDGRAETAYSKEVIKDYLRMHLCLPGWEKIMEKYSFDAAMIPKDSACAVAYFNSAASWKKVFTGNIDIVYIKDKIK